MKRERITDTAVRKRIKSGVLEVVQLDEMTHIVSRVDTVKDLKHKVKLQASEIRRLKDAKRNFQTEKVLYERNYLTMKAIIKANTALNIEDEWFDGSVMSLPKASAT